MNKWFSFEMVIMKSFICGMGWVGGSVGLCFPNWTFVNGPHFRLVNGEDMEISCWKPRGESSGKHFFSNLTILYYWGCAYKILKQVVSPAKRKKMSSNKSHIDWVGRKTARVTIKCLNLQPIVLKYADTTQVIFEKQLASCEKINWEDLGYKLCI